VSSFTSSILLGEKYADERSGLEGYATGVFFNENGCVEAYIEYAVRKPDGEIEIKKEYLNELRLTYRNQLATRPTREYECDIELGKEYVDIQTGLRGWACIIEFHEHMATRVTLRSVGYDKDGSKKLIYHSIDDFLLKSVTTGKVAKSKTDKRSPITREVTRPR
jgi:hypothetical protein